MTDNPTNPDNQHADHISVLERGEMALRQCQECHSLEAADSDTAIDHNETCSHHRDTTTSSSSSSSQPKSNYHVEIHDTAAGPFAEVWDDEYSTEESAAFLSLDEAVNMAETILEASQKYQDTATDADASEVTDT